MHIQVICALPEILPGLSVYLSIYPSIYLSLCCLYSVYGKYNGNLVDILLTFSRQGKPYSFTRLSNHSLTNSLIRLSTHSLTDLLSHLLTKPY